jgi:hypothetical protein
MAFSLISRSWVEDRWGANTKKPAKETWRVRLNDALGEWAR